MKRTRRSKSPARTPAKTGGGTAVTGDGAARRRSKSPPARTPAKAGGGAAETGDGAASQPTSAKDISLQDLLVLLPFDDFKSETADFKRFKCGTPAKTSTAVAKEAWNAFGKADKEIWGLLANGSRDLKGFKRSLPPTTSSDAVDVCYYYYSMKRDELQAQCGSAEHLVAPARFEPLSEAAPAHQSLGTKHQESAHSPAHQSFVTSREGSSSQRQSLHSSQQSPVSPSFSNLNPDGQNVGGHTAPRRRRAGFKLAPAWIAIAILIVLATVGQQWGTPTPVTESTNTAVSHSNMALLQRAKAISEQVSSQKRTALEAAKRLLAAAALKRKAKTAAASSTTNRGEHGTSEFN
jgi:hypothetical protein